MLSLSVRYSNWSCWKRDRRGLRQKVFCFVHDGVRWTRCSQIWPKARFGILFEISRCRRVISKILRMSYVPDNAVVDHFLVLFPTSVVPSRRVFEKLELVQSDANKMLHDKKNRNSKSGYERRTTGSCAPSPRAMGLKESESEATRLIDVNLKCMSEIDNEACDHQFPRTSIKFRREKVSRFPGSQTRYLTIFCRHETLGGAVDISLSTSDLEQRDFVHEKPFQTNKYVEDVASVTPVVCHSRDENSNRRTENARLCRCGRRSGGFGRFCRL